jgi:hypothetical protein
MPTAMANVITGTSHFFRNPSVGGGRVGEVRVVAAIFALSVGTARALGDSDPALPPPPPPEGEPGRPPPFPPLLFFFPIVSVEGTLRVSTTKISSELFHSVCTKRTPTVLSRSGKSRDY